MTSSPRIIGTLGTADGRGFVRMQDRFDTDVNDLWSAVTDPARLARWIGEVQGDLRPGGTFTARHASSGWEGTGRVVECDPPRRYLVATTGDDDGESTTEVVLTADGDHTILVVEERGMPADMVAGYGAGIQVHVEDLASYLAGGERCDSDARMAELYPVYRVVAEGA